MNDAEIRESVGRIVSEILPSARTGRDLPLLEAGLDSVGMVTLLNEVELRLGVAIPPEEVLPENFATVSTIAALVVRLRG